MKPCHIPLWSVVVLQCVLVLGVFGALIAIYTVEMNSSATDEIHKRLETRLIAARESILVPFVGGRDASANLATLLASSPSVFRVNVSSNGMNTDTNYLNVAGAMVANNPRIIFASQIAEDNTTVDSLDSLPYLTYLATTNGLSYKVYQNNLYVIESPLSVSESSFQSLNPTLINTNAKGFLTRAINQQVQRGDFSRYWSTYRMDPVLDRHTISAGGSLGTIQTPYCDLCGAFTVLLQKNGVRFSSKVSWLTTVVVDLSHLSSVLLGLTDGDVNSIASLFDISSSNLSHHKLLATTDSTVYITNSSSSSILFESHTSPNGQLNEWYVEALQNYGTVQKPQHSFKSSKRFISYAHVQLSSAQVVGALVPTQDLHLFVVVSTPSDSYLDAFDRTRNIAIGVGVGFAFFIALLCVAVMVAIYAPLQSMSHNISLAAQFENEDVRPTSSYITEIDKVGAAISKVNQILIDARPFMPASMLLSDSDADTEEKAKEFEDEKRLRSIAKKEKILKKIIEKSESSDHDEDEDTVQDDDEDDDDDFDEDEDEGSVETASANEDTVGGSTRPPTGVRHSILSAIDPSHRLVKAQPGKHSHNKRSGNSLLRSDSGVILKSRRVAVLCVNVRGFTSIPTFAINTLAEYSKTLLDMVSAAAASERGVIDSFHGDNFVISFNAVRSAASPAKKATMCSLAIASAASSTPFRSLSMGASCGTAIVGPLGNSSQRRMSIVGCCYTRALRLQKASATLERNVGPLFYAPTSSGMERVEEYSNCYNCLIDKNAYVESRDVADTLLVGSLAAPVKIRTIATVLNRMNTLFANSHKQSTAGGDQNPSGSTKNLPALQRINTLGGGNIMTVNSFSVNSVHPSNIHGDKGTMLSRFLNNQNNNAKEPSSTTVKPFDSEAVTWQGSDYSESMLYNGGVLTLLGNVNNNNSPLDPITNAANTSGGKALDDFIVKSREGSKGEDEVVNTLNKPFDEKLNASATVNKRSTTQVPEKERERVLIHEDSFISDMIQPLPTSNNPTQAVRTTLRTGGHQTTTTIVGAPSASTSSVSGRSESSISLADNKSTSVIGIGGKSGPKQRLLPLPAISVYSVLKLNAVTGGGRAGNTNGSFMGQSGQDEWMYEMQKKADNDVFKLLNQTMESLQRGDMIRALQLAEERLEKAIRTDSVEPTDKNIKADPLKEDTPLSLEETIMRMVVSSITTASASSPATAYSAALLPSALVTSSKSDKVSSVETPLHLKKSNTVVTAASFKNASFATADNGSAFGRDEDTASTYSTSNSQALTSSNPQGGLFSNARLIRPEDLLIHFEGQMINLVNSSTPVINSEESAWGNVRHLISSKRLVAETNNKPPTPPPAPLTNIEAAEYASWLRICKILSTVGAGGASFVTATSFL